MQVKMEIVGPDSNIPPSERKNVNVELHMKRGETFHIVQGQTVLEGDEARVWNIPPGGRLIITTPEATEEMFYDKEQGASVRRSAQANAGERADRASDNIRRPTQTPPPVAPTPPPQTPTRVTPSPAPQPPQPRVQTAQQPQPAFQPPGSKGDTPDPATKAGEGKDK